MSQNNIIFSIADVDTPKQLPHLPKGKDGPMGAKFQASSLRTTLISNTPKIKVGCNYIKVEISLGEPNYKNSPFYYFVYN